MFGKPKANPAETDGTASAAQAIEQAVQAPSAAKRAVTSESQDSKSTVGSGMTIIGKIAAEGDLVIFGRVEGEIRAGSLLIGNGAQVEGDVVAQELTISGRVKGTVHAGSVKLQGTAVVEGDIFHRSLSIDQNAVFEGLSRREGSDTKGAPAKGPALQLVAAAEEKPAVAKPDLKVDPASSLYAD
jgi:cytoskeletal protein CcmA (bactofilin family)